MSVIRVGRWRVYRPVVWVVILVICGYIAQDLVRWPDREPELSALEANAHRTAMSAIRARRQADSLAIVTRHVMRDNAAMARRVAGQTRALREAVARADSVATDSGSTAMQLRVELRRISDVSRRYADSVDALVSQTERLHRAIVAQDSAWRAERLANAEVVAAKDAVIEVLTDRDRCEVLGLFPCPSRRTAFLSGFAIPLLLIVL